MTSAIATTEIEGLKLLARGKVRDIYEVDDEHLLIVATDRVSAFDVVLDPAIPDKGRVLTALTVFWLRYFQLLEDEVGGLRDHLVAWEPKFWPDAAQAQADTLTGRALLVRRAPVLPVECIVRGYMAGSVWKGYQKDGKVAGVDAPAGMNLGDRFLPEPLFTPTTKAEQGEHDEPISYDEVVRRCGEQRAKGMRDLSIKVYSMARELAASRGVILCDTKFEFGLTRSQELFLIDEVLTPDSSRYWLKEDYDAREPGTLPTPIDKQVVRDYLLGISDWNKKAPAPRLPDEVVAEARATYLRIFRILTGVEMPDDATEALLAADRAGTDAAGKKLIEGDG